METATKWWIALAGAVTAALVAVGIVEETRKKPAPIHGGAGGKPPAGGCPAGTTWNGSFCEKVPPLKPLAPHPGAVVNLQALTLQPAIVPQPPIWSYTGIFTLAVSSDPSLAAGIDSIDFTGGASAPFGSTNVTQCSILLDGKAATATVHWHQQPSGQARSDTTTELRFI